MHARFKFGSVAGAPIGVSWSWLPVFALIVWTLAAGVFPDREPGLGTGAYIGMALLGAVAIYASPQPMGGSV